MPGETFYLIPFCIADRLLRDGGEISSSGSLYARANSSVISASCPQLQAIKTSPTIWASPKQIRGAAKDAKRRRSPGRSARRRGISPSHPSGRSTPDQLSRSKSWTNFRMVFPGDDDHALSANFDVEEPNMIDLGRGFESDTIVMTAKVSIDEKNIDEGKRSDHCKNEGISKLEENISSVSASFSKTLDYHLVSAGEINVRQAMDVKTFEVDGDISGHDLLNAGMDQHIAIDDIDGSTKSEVLGDDESISREAASPLLMSSLPEQKHHEKMKDSGKTIEIKCQTLQEMLAQQGSSLIHQEMKKMQGRRLTLGEHFSHKAPPPDYNQLRPSISSSASVACDGACNHKPKQQQNLALLGFCNMQSNHPSIVQQIRLHHRAGRIAAAAGTSRIDGHRPIREACDHRSGMKVVNPPSTLLSDGSNHHATKLNIEIKAGSRNSTDGLGSDSSRTRYTGETSTSTDTFDLARMKQNNPTEAQAWAERRRGPACPFPSSLSPYSQRPPDFEFSGERSKGETADSFVERMKLDDPTEGRTECSGQHNAARPFPSLVPASPLPGARNYNTTSTIMSSTGMSLPSYVVSPRFSMRRLRNLRWQSHNRKPLSPIIELTSPELQCLVISPPPPSPLLLFP